MNHEQLIGSVAGILTSIAMLPQLVKVIRTKETGDLSLMMICILITGVALWVYYGALRTDMPVILSNSFSVLINAALLTCFFLFRHKGRDSN